MQIEGAEPAMLDMAPLRDPIASDVPVRADAFIQRRFDHVDTLRTFPESGRVVRETDVVNFREPAFRRYRIAVLTVLHGRRDLCDPDDHPWDA